MAGLIAPHGGVSEPVDRTVPEEQTAAFARLLDELPKLTVSKADLATLYRRVTGGKGASGIASCENGYCQNCNIEQTPQAIADLSNDHIVQCSTCGALLYRA